MEQLVAHHRRGLSFQSTQALARLLAATKPQHLLRSTLISKELRDRFDAVTVRVWEVAIDLTPDMRE